VSATKRFPSRSNARPLATIPCAVPGGNDRFCRPTPTEFVIGGTRKSTVAAPPDRPTRNTRPRVVPPSETYRFPSSSKASPLAPGVPVAKPVATGVGVAVLGRTTPISSPFAPKPVR
jgi:hypothetical protein